MKPILLAEHEPDVRLLLNLKLSAHGFTVIEAETSADALAALQRHPIALLLLDLDLPGQAAWTILDHARQNRRPGVVGLTRTAAPEKVWGPAHGFDAFLVKPFDLEALDRLPGLATHLISVERAPVLPVSPPLTLGALTIDPSIDLVTVAGRELRLTDTEYRVFSALLHSSRRPVDVPSLLAEIWGEDAESSSASVRLRFIIYRIRRKLEAAGAAAGVIVNIRGGGYAYYPQGTEPRRRRTTPVPVLSGTTG